jgi:hypothetical protein
MTHPHDLKHPALKLRVYMEPQRIAETRRRIKILAAIRSTTISSLIAEAVSDFLDKHLPNESKPI